MFVILYKDTSHLHMSSKRPRDEEISAIDSVMKNDDLRGQYGYLPHVVGDYPDNLCSRRPLLLKYGRVHGNVCGKIISMTK